jgi:hypothetical protein
MKYIKHIINLILITNILLALNHGFGIGLTDSGRNIYYEAGFQISTTDEVVVNTGFHFEKSLSLSMDIFGNLYKSPDTKSTISNVKVGYIKKLFNSSLVGTFRPIVMAQIGFDGLINQQSNLTKTKVEWFPNYMLSMGFEFDSNKTKNRIVFGYMNSDVITGDIIMNITLFWKK